MLHITFLVFISLKNKQIILNFKHHYLHTWNFHNHFPFLLFLQELWLLMTLEWVVVSIVKLVVGGCVWWKGRNQHIWKKRRDLRTSNVLHQLTEYETQILRSYRVENEGCFEKDHFMFFGFQCSLQIFHTHERANPTFEMPHQKR